MRRNIIITVISVVVCAACQRSMTIDEEKVIFQADTMSNVVYEPVDNANKQLWNQQVQKELDYYMSRHNVEDEGFDMVARYAEHGDTLLSAYMPRGVFTPLSMLHLSMLPQSGVGVQQLPTGSFIIGVWQADTLASGVRIDTTGIYAGQFDRYLQAHGHGSCRSLDGSYYEGHFERDQRNGFGFSVSPRNLLAGIWKNDRFLGERMRYTSDRIYGIDISRYQHEQGRKRFPIDWEKMRITSFGQKARQNIIGKVDYPVSFVYIKATEGISIHNRYYASDCAAARKQGIRVGAYHFFSTKQDGRMQANYFLSQAVMHNGDLPPMLDIEPSDVLIKQMGGIERLFNEIREWIEIVEKRTGAHPLLYMNQRFVRKYLDEAPDLKNNYLVWIARYGEYKPDVHLALWQLSADGRVSGIRGEVDINVFNGYDGQWNEFLQQECVSRSINIK